MVAGMELNSIELDNWLKKKLKQILQQSRTMKNKNVINYVAPGPANY